jgi:large subunit ribosomal protein L10
VDRAQKEQKVAELNETFGAVNLLVVTQNNGGTKFEALQTLFTGPTAIAYSDDPVAAAKVCVEFAKKNAKLSLVGGALGEEVLDADGVTALAKLPSLDELRGKLIGTLQAPATKVAMVLQAAGPRL